MKNSNPAFFWRQGAFALLAGFLIALTIYTFGSSTAQARPASGQLSTKDHTMKIRLIVGEQVATATLYDNATAKDFASLLPLSLTMTDYDKIERISDLPRKLSTQDAPEGMTPVAGELTHYAPWGNLAIFTKPRSFARNLLPIGKIDEGLSIISQPGPYKVSIELIEN